MGKVTIFKPLVGNVNLGQSTSRFPIITPKIKVRYENKLVTIDDTPACVCLFLKKKKSNCLILFKCIERSITCRTVL